MWNNADLRLVKSRGFVEGLEARDRSSTGKVGEAMWIEIDYNR